MIPASMLRALRIVPVSLALLACASTPFAPSSIGMRFEPRDAAHARYVHRDSGVGFVMPAHADTGEREEDDAGFERVVLSVRVNDATYRVVVFRPIDGTEVHPADAITRLADGLIEGQTPARDEPTMVQTHAARRITLPHATSSGSRAAFLIAADDHALVMLELVGPGDVDVLAEPFFASLELGCDR